MWLMTLTVALVVMTLLQRFTRAAPLDARATLALGFLLIVAYAGGEVARLLKLPRITGVMVAALAVGPAWLGLVRADEILALQFIGTGAFALLALAAGTELRFARVRAFRTTVSRVAVGVVVAPFLGVAFVVLTVSPWFPLTAHQPLSDALTVALFLGAAAAVSSPVLAAALVRRREPADSVSRDILDITLVQLLLSAVLVVLLLLLMQALGTPGAVQPGISARTAIRFGGSIGAGILLGVAVTQYLGVIRQQLTLVVLAVAAMIALGAHLVAIEPTLTAVAAGVTLANVAPAQADRVRGWFRDGAQPLYTAGLALLAVAFNVGALREWWPWILLLAGVRLTALRGGLAWAGRDPRVNGVVAERGWLGFIAQAGFAISLAALARDAFPEWGISLESLILAMIGVHAIAGPVLFDWVLGLTHAGPEEGHGSETRQDARAGETGEAVALAGAGWGDRSGGM